MSFTAIRVFCSILAAAGCVAAANPGRVILNLDGEWAIGESMEADRMPSMFGHRVQVPGLINQAQPRFPQVDEFESRELIDKKVRMKLLPESAFTKEVGFSKQPRNYFWYRRTFRAPAKKEVAILKVNKAQFGVQVWLNGKKMGDHLNCFAAGFFDLTPAMDWTSENTLVARVGAHPAVLPKDVPAGTDFEKLIWTPGIYDSVSLHLTDGPVIESVQVAPKIQSSSILVQTLVKSYGKASNVSLRARVRPWKGGGNPVEGKALAVRLAAGESKVITQTVSIPNARLWSPEDPFLYVLESSTGGDSLETRFGMREFRFDTPTKRAYLNGKVYFLRGSNITLHRFFEDPKIGNLPWDEAWVRKLLVEIPKKMGWNSFRFCIGPVPDRWMDIADEAGLLIQNEFFIWTGGRGWDNWHDEWTAETLVRQYSEWMRDNWNHPSQAIWDASNETRGDLIAKHVIPVVRKLDLSDRPWDNGYTDPVGPDDPVEDHPYEHSRNWANMKPGFEMVELERMTGAKSTGVHPTGRAAIINEYGWLWVNRDGTPTELTTNVYAKILGPNATPAERIEANNYLLGGLTEFWRSTRNFAGVLHFVYLTCSYPGVYTSDHFKDIEKLELHESFADYVGESFRPLGVYLNYWRPRETPRSKREIAVSLVNDGYEASAGALTVHFRQPGEAPRTAATTPYAVAPLGQQTYRFDVEFPDSAGKYVLEVLAQPQKAGAQPTLSRRKVEIGQERAASEE
jgi:beta-galactosidase